VVRRVRRQQHLLGKDCNVLPKPRRHATFFWDYRWVARTNNDNTEWPIRLYSWHAQTKRQTLDCLMEWISRPRIRLRSVSKKVTTCTSTWRHQVPFCLVALPAMHKNLQSDFELPSMTHKQSCAGAQDAHICEDSHLPLSKPRRFDANSLMRNIAVDENTNEQPSPRRTVPDVLANVLVSIPSKDALEQNNITR
jgi:hypothetical protein